MAPSDELNPGPVAPTTTGLSASQRNEAARSSAILRTSSLAFAFASASTYPTWQTPPRAEACHDQDLSFGGFPGGLTLADRKRAPADDRCEGVASAAPLARKAPFDAAPVNAVEAP